MPKIVMFPHPSREFSPKFVDEQGMCDWNTTTDHFRRFLLSRGDYVDDAGALQTGYLLFWSEWEAKTHVTELSSPVGQHLATWLHEPQYPTPCPPAGSGCSHGYQNTDPCVFGDSFKYALCRQYGRGGASALQDLDPGSLIVFGGTKGGTFYLDTVFVVGKKTPYDGPDTARAVQCSNEYRILTLNQTRGKFSFYRGITWAQREQNQGLYSFTPGKVLSNRANLSALPVALRDRCALNFNSLNQIIGSPADFFKVNNWRIFKPMDASMDLIQQVWNELLNQVTANHFVPCVHFPWPQQVSGNSNAASIPMSGQII